MKIISFLTVYNDWDYLDATIESFKNFPDKLFIVEGAWKSSQKFGANPRSNEKTYEIINKHIDNERVFLIQANEEREREQRQVGLELAKKEGAEWCFMLDADEVYKKKNLDTIKNILTSLPKEVLMCKVNSFNFVNSFAKYYDGSNKRIYRVTPKAKFVMDNDVFWPDSNGAYAELDGDDTKFFHYNYVKPNVEAFRLKMNYQDEQTPELPSLYNRGYGFKDGKYEIPVSESEIFNFVGKHPEVMANHPYIVGNIYNDKKIEFGEE